MQEHKASAGFLWVILTLTVLVLGMGVFGAACTSEPPPESSPPVEVQEAAPETPELEPPANGEEQVEEEKQQPEGE